MNKMAKILAQGAEDDFRKNRLLNGSKQMQGILRLLSSLFPTVILC
jgi:hypothetical protein